MFTSDDIKGYISECEEHDDLFNALTPQEQVLVYQRLEDFLLYLENR